MFFLLLACFFIITSCQAQVPRVGLCYKNRLKIPDFNPYGILGEWYVYAGYPTCDPPGRCRRTEFIDDHEGTIIAAVKQLSTEHTFQVYETADFLKYTNNATFVITQSENSRYVGQNLLIWSTDYTSYLLKGGCINFRDASLHYAWFLTRSPNPSPSVIEKINELIQIEGVLPEYLQKVDQTNCPAKF